MIESGPAVCFLKDLPPLFTCAACREILIDAAQPRIKSAPRNIIRVSCGESKSRSHEQSCVNAGLFTVSPFNLMSIAWREGRTLRASNLERLTCTGTSGTWTDTRFGKPTNTRSLQQACNDKVCGSEHCDRFLLARNLFNSHSAGQCIFAGLASVNKRNLMVRECKVSKCLSRSVIKSLAYTGLLDF